MSCWQERKGKKEEEGENGYQGSIQESFLASNKKYKLWARIHIMDSLISDQSFINRNYLHALPASHGKHWVPPPVSLPFREHQGQLCIYIWNIMTTLSQKALTYDNDHLLNPLKKLKTYGRTSFQKNQLERVTKTTYFVANIAKSEL